VKVGVFDGTGHPTHTRGVTAVPGLYFLGLPWLHTWGSGRFLGIARDAEHIASCIAGPESRPGAGTGARAPLDGTAVAGWLAGASRTASPVSAARAAGTGGARAASDPAGSR
jgi:putative flavoprotein involved in K+ transport